MFPSNLHTMIHFLRFDFPDVYHIKVGILQDFFSFDTSLIFQVTNDLQSPLFPYLFVWCPKNPVTFMERAVILPSMYDNI